MKVVLSYYLFDHCIKGSTELIWLSEWSIPANPNHHQNLKEKNLYITHQQQKCITAISCHYSNRNIYRSCNTSMPTAIGFWQSFVAMVIVLVKLHSKSLVDSPYIFVRDLASTFFKVGNWSRIEHVWQIRTSYMNRSML